MKKHLIVIVTVLAMLAMFTGTAAAAPSYSGSATLVSVIYVPGKGPVFTFEVRGEFSATNLKGSLHVENGADFDLYCIQVNASTVTCTVSKKAAGHDVVLSFGGLTFWAHAPAAPEFCYSIYDWTPTQDAWQQYGSYCQETDANYGDLLQWDNPYWGPSPYLFMPGSPTCPFNVTGDAYYFPGCPTLPF